MHLHIAQANSAFYIIWDGSGATTGKFTLMLQPPTRLGTAWRVQMMYFSSPIDTVKVLTIDCYFTTGLALSLPRKQSAMSRLGEVTSQTAARTPTTRRPQFTIDAILESQHSSTPAVTCNSSSSRGSDEADIARSTCGDTDSSTANNDSEGQRGRRHKTMLEVASDVERVANRSSALSEQPAALFASDAAVDNANRRSTSSNIVFPAPPSAAAAVDQLRRGGSQCSSLLARTAAEFQRRRQHRVDQLRSFSDLFFAQYQQYQRDLRQRFNAGQQLHRHHQYQHQQRQDQQLSNIHSRQDYRLRHLLPTGRTPTPVGSAPSRFDRERHWIPGEPSSLPGYHHCPPGQDLTERPGPDRPLVQDDIERDCASCPRRSAASGHDDDWASRAAADRDVIDDDERCDETDELAVDFSNRHDPPASTDFGQSLQE